MNEIDVYKNDVRIVNYFKKNAIVELQSKRDEMEEYKKTKKDLMIDFLSSIFKTNPLASIIKDSIIPLIYEEISVFEGVESVKIPKIDDFKIDDLD